MSEVATRTPAMELVQRVRAADFQEQIALVLPPHVSAQTWTRYLVTVLLEKPEIAEGADPASLLTAFTKAAVYGIVPDGKLAAVIKRGGKVTYDLMAPGMRQWAAEYGWATRSNVVYQHDAFDYTDEPPTLTHTRVRPGRERGTLVAAYAIAEHPRWGRRQKVMFREALDKRREKAQTQAIWNAWEDEMYEKTVLRALIDDLEKPERDRLERLALPDPDASQAAIFGPPAREAFEIAAPSSTAGHSGEGRQAADAPSPLASAAADPEPVFDEVDWPEKDYTLDNAVAAGRVKIPTGPFTGVPIAEAHERDEQKFFKWAAWALRQGKHKPDGDEPLIGNALRAYLLVHAPEMVEEGA